MRKSIVCLFVALVVVSWSVDAFAVSPDSSTSQRRAPTRFGKIGEFDPDEFVYPVAENLNLILTTNETGLMIRGLDFPPPKDANTRMMELNPVVRVQEWYEVEGVKELVVPEEINGKKVTELGDGALSKSGTIEKIVLPETVEKIGAYAFAFGKSLRDVVLPKGLNELGNEAFLECRALEKIDIPEKIETIKDGTFNGCAALNSVKLPEGVKSIGTRAFQSCVALEAIRLPDAVEKIGFDAFSNCPKLASINIPSSLEEIPYGFFAFSKIENVAIPDGVKSIEMGAFWSATLKSIKIGKNVETIEPGAFRGLVNLERIEVDSENKSFKVEDDALFTIDGKRLIALFSTSRSAVARKLPEGLETIDKGAFTNALNLTVTIPASVLTIDDEAFEPCEPRQPLEIIVEEDNPNYKSENLALLTKDGKRFIQAPRGREGEFAIPQGVEETGKIAFRGTKFEKIVVPGSLKTIQTETFARLLKTKEIVLEEGVETIEARAFTANPDLETIVIPKSVVKIAPVVPTSPDGRRIFHETPTNPFDPKTALRVYKGGYAERWAKESRVKYETID